MFKIKLFTYKQDIYHIQIHVPGHLLKRYFIHWIFSSLLREKVEKKVLLEKMFSYNVFGSYFPSPNSSQFLPTFLPIQFYILFSVFKLKKQTKWSKHKGKTPTKTSQKYMEKKNKQKRPTKAKWDKKFIKYHWVHFAFDNYWAWDLTWHVVNILSEIPLEKIIFPLLLGDNLK